MSIHLERLILDRGKFIAILLTIIASEDRRYSRSNVKMVKFFIQIVNNIKQIDDRDDGVSVN
jgi:hypothetical protein